MIEHPENDLGRDLDFMNKLPRASLDDFSDADSELEHLADAPDPLQQAAANRHSTAQALRFWAVGFALSLIVGLVPLVIFRQLGGPDCAAGNAVWLCSNTQRLIWIPLAVVVPTVAMIGSGILLLRKLNSYVRWSTWMGVFWFFALSFMAWGISALQALLDMNR